VNAAPLLHLSPQPAVLLLTLGLLLLYLELNRPGLVLPGALGLLAVLFSLASLQRSVVPAAAALLGTACALLLLDLLRPTPVLVALGATLALVLGFSLVLGSAPLSRATAAACGLVLGLGTSALTRFARRARANKAVN
jgi:membrane-bound serine protease (ClpP class)